jgi:hypothetical protein
MDVLRPNEPGLTVWRRYVVEPIGRIGLDQRQMRAAFQRLNGIVVSRSVRPEIYVAANYCGLRRGYNAE